MSLRYFVIGVLAVCVVEDAAATTYALRPVPHRRYSPNGKYFFDYTVDRTRVLDVHAMYASDRPDEPLWSTEEFIYLDSADENDGTLYVANDGKTIAYIDLSWPRDLDTVFDGNYSITVIGQRGVIEEHIANRSLSCRLRYLDAPVEELWTRIANLAAIEPTSSRSGETVSVTTLSAMTYVVSMGTGEIVSRYPNPWYWLLMVFVYGVPTLLLAKWLLRRRRPPEELLKDGSELSLWSTHPMLVWINTVVVVINLTAFAATFLYCTSVDRFPLIWHVKVYELAQSVSLASCQVILVLIPGSVVATLVRYRYERRIDFVAPWLATLAFPVMATAHDELFYWMTRSPYPLIKMFTFGWWF